MYLTRAEINEMDKDRLLAFLRKGIPEGHHIDYKVALSGKSKTKQYREFLKDTTAFANANGGHIFIGVKEPTKNKSPNDQIVGIPSGDNLAQDLERLASSGAIDPRIAGLIICPVLIEPNLWIVVVHVPPSLGRPHMVVYEKQSNFYIRHSESVQKMTSYDIRQAVLTSAAAEEQGKAYASEQHSRLSKAFIQSSPGFILQATPLIRPESPIDVFANNVIEALRSSDRNSRHGGYQMGLGSMT
jgi:hypothetical protein